MAGVGNHYIAQRGGFSCYITSFTTTPLIMADGVSSTALPAIATGEALEVISSDADDDGSPAGNGARTVTVVFLTIAGAVTSETKTMNGITAVAMTNTAIGRVLGVFVATVGSTGSNEGTIDVRTVSGATVRARIPIGQNAAPMARTTIEAGKTGLYRGFRLANTGGTGSPLRITYFIEADVNRLTGAVNENVYSVIDWGVANLGSGEIGSTPGANQSGRKLYLPALTTIRARCVTDTGTCIGASGFVYIERLP